MGIQKILALACLVGLWGCAPEPAPNSGGDGRKTDSTLAGDDNAGGGPPGGGDLFVPDNPPFEIDDIVVHGSPDTGEILWSSDSTYDHEGGQSKFATDSRFELRVTISEHGKGEDSRGKECASLPWGATEFGVTVVIRKAGAGGGGTSYTFGNLVSGRASEVRSLRVPANAEKVALDIRGVKWNYACAIHYGNCTGGSADLQPPHGDRNCFNIKLEFATDETNSL